MGSRAQQLKFIQHVEKGILSAVVAVCEENHLTYFISGGTYLGAVRHKGFIPWDDDIDIALPRDDYEKLLELLPIFLPQQYELVSYSTSAEYNFLCAQVRDSRVQIEMTDYVPTIRQSCWIDIFPLDGAPAPGLSRRLWKLKLNYYELMWGFSRIDESSNHHQGRSLPKRIAISFGHLLRLGKLMDSKKWCVKRERALKSVPFGSTDYVLNAVGAYKFNSIFNYREVYGDGACYEFDGMLLNGPAEFDKYLKQIYGEYMELPDEDKRNWHGTRFVTKHKYTVGYTQGTYDMFHVGHLNLIEHAKEYCDYLIVGINSDDLVWSYKKKHPVVSQDDRARIIASLSNVDEVIVVDTLDKKELAQKEPFEAVFIGDDWKGNPRWVKTEEDLGAIGIDVLYLPHTDGVSSTSLRPVKDDCVKEF